MKDKIIATLTLASIFSLFLYYKVVSVDNEVISYSSEVINEDKITINIVDDFDFEEDKDESIENISDSDLNAENCLLSLEQTDEFLFSEAFQYYRSCLGKDEIFSWNTKKYKTLLSNEVVIEQNINDLESIVVQNLNNVDKHHLELPNQILGLNSNK